MRYRCLYIYVYQRKYFQDQNSGPIYKNNSNNKCMLDVYILTMLMNSFVGKFQTVF